MTAKIDRLKAREVASALGLDETTVVALATMKEDEAAKALVKVDPTTRARVLAMLRGLRA
jgi:hypothetical protein